MQDAVLGFAFDPSSGKVALIKKIKPAWQCGRINGVGGKVEPSETPAQAIVREFREETSLQIDGDKWEHVFTFFENGWGVWVYRARVDLSHIRSPEEEKVELYDPTDLPVSVMSNLRWIVPLLAFEEVQHPFAIWTGRPK